MEVEVTSFIGKPVYNMRGQFVGVVDSVLLDLPGRRVGSLVLTRTNQLLVEGGLSVAVPFRWVGACKDIIILNNFPEHVTAPEVEEAVEMAA